MNQNRREFTLYETLLVLVITLSLTVLVGTQSHRQYQRMAERAFWSTWQQMWTAGRQVAQQQRRPVAVKINRQTGELTIYQMAPYHELHRLTPPKSLKWRGGAYEWGISATGAAPALTVEWFSTANHLWWYQTFQLGGAIFYVGATSKRH